MKILATYKGHQYIEYDNFDIDKWEDIELIKEIDCSNQQLTSIPEDICKLVNLKRLYCQNNQLTSLPENIGNLSKLKFLDCSNNKINSFPDSIINLENLEYIDYENNPINDSTFKASASKSLVQDLEAEASED